MIASALVLLAGGDICTALETRQPVDHVVVVGVAGIDLRHGWTWIGSFGCGDRVLSLVLSDPAVLESEGGQQVAKAFDRVEEQMIAERDLGPRHETGIRLRASGALVWEDDDPIPTFRISEVEALEAGQ